MTRTLVIILCTAALFTAMIRRIPYGWSGEFVTLRVAGELIASRQSPYRPELQLPRQFALRGGDPAHLVPYFNLPWLALACAPLSRLTFSTGQLIWSYLGSLALVGSGWLLTGVMPSLSRTAMVTLCLTFPLSLFANWMGQLSPMVLFLIVAHWRLIEAGYDKLAGGTLALATFKPHLVVVLVLGLLLRSVRAMRWGVVAGFVATMMALCLASYAFLPSWPYEFSWALRNIRLITEDRPEVGAAWWTVLRAAGLSGWFLVAAYASAALPIASLIVRSAWRAEGPVFDLLAWGLLAPFFLSPYMQIYEFPLLIPAFLWALRGSIPVLAMVSLFGMMFGLYANLVAILNRGFAPGSMFWFPAFVFIGLAVSAHRGGPELRRERRHGIEKDRTSDSGVA